MRTILLTIINTNFTQGRDWIFKLEDDRGKIHYVMNDGFYKKHQLKSPIIRQHLDNYDKGSTLLALSTVIEELNVVTDLK